MTELICPYCDETCEPSPDSNEPNVTYEHECEHCGKNFVYTLEYYAHYSESRADCLNGSEHDWQDIKGWPPEHFTGKQRCSNCDKRREVQ